MARFQVQDPHFALVKSPCWLNQTFLGSISSIPFFWLNHNFLLVKSHFSLVNSHFWSNQMLSWLNHTCSSWNPIPWINHYFHYFVCLNPFLVLWFPLIVVLSPSATGFPSSSSQDAAVVFAAQTACHGTWGLNGQRIGMYHCMIIRISWNHN